MSVTRLGGHARVSRPSKAAEGLDRAIKHVNTQAAPHKMPDEADICAETRLYQPCVALNAESPLSSYASFCANVRTTDAALRCTFATGHDAPASERQCAPSYDGIGAPDRVTLISVP
jgi:hypothetical protein